MIFVDSDAYISLYSEQDNNRKHALAILKILPKEDQFITSWDVIDEVATKLSRFSTQEISYRFLQETLSSDTQIVFPTSEILSSVHTLFLTQSSKQVSWTDCTNMVIAKEFGITTFFSFDHHYEQNGFTLLKSKK